MKIADCNDKKPIDIPYMCIKIIPKDISNAEFIKGIDPKTGELYNLKIQGATLEVIEEETENDKV